MSTGAKVAVVVGGAIAIAIAVGILLVTKFVVDTADDAVQGAAPAIEDALETANDELKAQQRARAKCLERAEGNAKKIDACNEVTGGNEIDDTLIDPGPGLGPRGPGP